MLHSVTACPVCDNNQFEQFLECKDHTVSHETFQLRTCTHCNLVLTSPRPEDIDLPRYYQSDSYISHSAKSHNLTDRLYKLSRNFTMRWKYKLITTHSIQPPQSILDFGCGTGTFLAECKKQNMTTTGVEPSLAARTRAIENTGSTIAAELDQVDGTFEAITLWHVLEHVSHLNATLDHLSTHMEKNGTMFIAVPNLKSADARIYQQAWAAYDVPRHLWHFARQTMKELLSRHQLQLVRTLPMPLDAYYVCLLSEKYHNGKINPASMAKAFIRGWQSNRSAKQTGEYSSLIYIVRK